MIIKKNSLFVYTIFCVVITTLIIIILYPYSFFKVALIPYVLSFYLFGYLLIHNFYISYDLINLQNVFNLFALLYTNYGIGELIIKNEPISNNYLWAVYLSYFSIIVFNVFYSNCKQRDFIFLNNNEFNNEFVYNSNIIRLTIFVLLLISLFAEFYLIIKSFGFSTYVSLSRGERTLNLKGFGFLTFYKSTIPLISSIYLFLFIKENRRTDFLFFLFSCSISIFNAVINGSRAELISIILPIIFLLSYFKKVSNRTVIFIGILMVLLFGLWKSLYNEHRQISFDSEFNTWIKVCSNVRGDESLNFFYGKTYMDTFANLIIPFTKVEALSDWYVRTYEYNAYIMGNGRGFPSVLEAYLNFGYFGIFLVYGFYGFLFKQFHKKTDLSIILYMIILLSIYQLFRSEAYSIWKNMMWFRIYPTIIIFIISKQRISIKR